MFNAASLVAAPTPLQWDQIAPEKSTVNDTKTTLWMLDDRLRVTYREAVSSYLVPGTNTANLTRNGLGFDNAASSERIDATVWKTGSMALSLYAEYNRVGADFLAPTFAIKPQDAFFTANSTTTRVAAHSSRERSGSRSSSVLSRASFRTTPRQKWKTWSECRWVSSSFWAAAAAFPKAWNGRCRCPRMPRSGEGA